MSATPSTHPFEVGRSYRVRKSFPAMRDDFHEGEVLKYKESAYSWYDGMTGYFFIDENEAIRSWDVHDKDSVGISIDLFEAL
jgi:hypothetical protein